MQNKENPVGTLYEVCAVAHFENKFEYEEVGNEHEKKFRCSILIEKWTISTEEAYGTKKEAQRATCLKVLARLPVINLETLAASRRGSDHSLAFQYTHDFEEHKLHFESEWCKKKDEAKRQLLQKILVHFLENDYSTPAASSSPRPSSNHAEDIELQVKEMMIKWQKENLPVIKKALLLSERKDDDEIEAKLNNYLTIAFIHPSFAYSEAIKTAMQKYLRSKNVNYERFEFLGDALLGLVVARELFDENDIDTPGTLTSKRRQRVQTEACAENLKKLGLEKFIIHRDSLISHSVKVLGDVFEAILGALYLVYEEEAFKLVERYTKHESQ